MNYLMNLNNFILKYKKKMKTNLDSIYNKEEEINFLSKETYFPMYKAINEIFNPNSIADAGDTP